MAIQFAWLSLLFPLVGVLLTPLFARVHPALRDFAAVAFSFLTAVATVMLIPSLFADDLLPLEAKSIWLEAPMRVTFGVLLDPLSIVLANVVAVISFFIMVYCLGYMKGDPGLTRFWMLMNGFIGSMLLLVLSGDLVFMFLAWKLVGLCSYGLIGYYFKDDREYWIGGPSPFPFNVPSANALKALIVTSVGDMLMLAGLLVVYSYSGTLNIRELYETVPDWLPTLAASPGILILVTFLLIAGPVGKSAQFPLHEWLPEAMSGPGPVSALIHAATMVKSGVFFVARLIPIFYYGYWVAGIEEARYFFVIVAWVGGITAFLAASQGLVAKELKKVLAYSTGSQIGYMMLALGVAGFTADALADGYTAGIFHLMSHAMFKACLFLCAGTVIHAAHTLYIDEMGGLRRYLPLTWIFMSVAALSLMGVPPLAGFWSKEAVLKATFAADQYALAAVAVVTVLLTAFYSVRFLGMVFHGQPSAHLRHVEEHGAHISEGYRTQTFAVGVLAVSIVALGLVGLRAEEWFHHLFEVGLAGQLPHGEDHIGHAMPVKSSLLTYGVPAFSIGALAVGAFAGYVLYITGRWRPPKWLDASAPIRGLYLFLWERWFIDKTLKLVFVQGTLKVAALVRQIEVFLDALINRRTPGSLIGGSSALLRLMRADAVSLSASLIYVIGVLVVMAAIALVRAS